MYSGTSAIMLFIYSLGENTKPKLQQRKLNENTESIMSWITYRNIHDNLNEMENPRVYIPKRVRCPHSCDQQHLMTRAYLLKPASFNVSPNRTQMCVILYIEIV